MSNQDFFEQMNQKQQMQFKKTMKILKLIFFIIVPLLIIGVVVFNLLTNYIWMDSLGFESVFTTILMTKAILGLAGFILFMVITFFTIRLIQRSYVHSLNQNIIPEYMLNKKKSRKGIFVISILFGLLGTLIVQNVGWEPALKLLNYEPFGINDPHFNYDISFYIFVLPFLNFVVNLLLVVSFIVLVLLIGAYSVFGMYRHSRYAQIHMGLTLSIVGILLAASHLLEPYETLLTNKVNIFQQSSVYGLSFTDHFINIPKSYILAIVAVVGIIWVIISLNRGKLKAAIMPVFIYVALLIVGQLTSVIVQQFIVSPNELVRETPYLERNIEFTKTAYQLSDIEEKEHPGNYSLSGDMIERNQLIIDNVRINDARPILNVYNQLQTIRAYYTFNDVDIDRYFVDGEYMQVFIAARELDRDGLTEQAKTWRNEKLRYTHGYGIAMSHVNEVTKQGQPEYVMKNLPVEGPIEVTRPQIYFGEEPYQNVIVNSKVEEFDYPLGDENVSHRFSADSGIPMTGLNRFLFGIKDGSLRTIFSDQITSDSRFLETRNIKERVNRIAPFFDYDKDPYIVIREDGSLTWVMDAYLQAENYPYSEPFEGKKSYIRNSVKVGIDAYTGEVDFYIVDSSDPLLLTYQNMFPKLFTEEIPEDLRSHFRYPEKLFKTQARMYGTYHMSDLEIFYNREDFWQFPTEKYFNEDIEVEPYYISTKLPDEDQEEFILMTSYTPKNRQNMIAWIGVRNDGENYGELFVYRFPKQKNIYGPQQIENRINQDSYISQQLNLWSQGGSNVIRGNLLAIPIEDTILYVEPIYIESSNETSLPEVKQVVVAYGDYIVMESTFDKALDRILQYVETGQPGNVTEPDEGETEQPILNAEEHLRDLAQLFDDYQQALSQSDWQRAAELMTEIESLLTEVQ
ncbi:UPF0182 family membrane protein [Bacillaceae bacterium W0354]